MGVDAVTCALGELIETVAPIPDTQLGGAQAKNRLTRRLSRSLRIMENVRTANGRIATAGPKKTRGLINAMIRDLEHGIAKGKVDPSTGNSLIAMLNAVLGDLQPLIQRR